MRPRRAGYPGLMPAKSTKVVGYHRRPDIGLEMVEPAPCAASPAIGALEARDAGLDAGAEVAQPAIDPSALGHVGDGQAALLVKGDITDAAGFGLIEIIAAGIAAIGGDLAGRS